MTTLPIVIGFVISLIIGNGGDYKTIVLEKKGDVLTIYRKKAGRAGFPETIGTLTPTEAVSLKAFLNENYPE
jgi:uncharacterized protein YgiB involved in biofilm formation